MITGKMRTKALHLLPLITIIKNTADYERKDAILILIGVCK